MTVFGKVVLNIVLLLGFGAVAYGLVTYIKNEEITPIIQPVVVASTTTEVSSTTEATTTIATSTNATSSKPVRSGKGKPVFTSILQQGGTLKCSITQPMGQMISTGIVFIDKALVRAEFAVSVMDKTIRTTMIVRDGYMYSWTDTDPLHGSKVSMPTSAQAKSSSKVRTWNGDQVSDYSCDPWTPDEKLFDIPATVTFKEV